MGLTTISSTSEISLTTSTEYASGQVHVAQVVPRWYYQRGPTTAGCSPDAPTPDDFNISISKKPRHNRRQLPPALLGRCCSNHLPCGLRRMSDRPGHELLRHVLSTATSLCVTTHSHHLSTLRLVIPAWGGRAACQRDQSRPRHRATLSCAYDPSRLAAFGPSLIYHTSGYMQAENAASQRATELQISHVQVGVTLHCSRLGGRCPYTHKTLSKNREASLADFVARPS